MGFVIDLDQEELSSGEDLDQKEVTAGGFVLFEDTLFGVDLDQNETQHFGGPHTQKKIPQGMACRVLCASTGE